MVLLNLKYPQYYYIIFVYKSQSSRIKVIICPFWFAGTVGQVIQSPVTLDVCWVSVEIFIPEMFRRGQDGFSVRVLYSGVTTHWSTEIKSFEFRKGNNILETMNLTHTHRHGCHHFSILIYHFSFAQKI